MNIGISMRLAAGLAILAFAVPALAQTYTVIDCPGFAYSHAFGINDFGTIVGDCELLDGCHGHKPRIPACSVEDRAVT